MPPIFVLDTSVLLHDALAFLSFAGAQVVLPAVVIEELDKQKRRPDEVGKMARETARHLDHLRNQGNLSAGVPLPGGGCLRIELNHQQRQSPFVDLTNDNRLLGVALKLQEQGAVTLVSRDTILRIKADALGLTAIDYETAPTHTAAHPGYQTLAVSPEEIDHFYKSKALPSDLPLNSFVILKAPPSQSALGRVHPGGLLKPLLDAPAWGVSPRNAQQRMALDLLLDDRIQLVTLAGKAGTGKTLLTLAAGLQKTEEEARYQRLLVSRPVIPLGRDLGYLPGDKDEKLRPWMQPIYDNLEYLFGLTNQSIDNILAGLNRGIRVEALTYIRGRSLPRQFFIIDEAQNLTKHEVKTIISRAGEGSKVVLLGDPEQIDHPYLDQAENGLMHTARQFQGQALAGHVTLLKGERSELAQLAANLL